MHSLAGLILACGICASIARAGPPLISDDPHTVGPGRMEVVLAAGAADLGDFSDLFAPAVDVTLGIAEGLDIGFVASPVFTFASGQPTESVGAADIAVKWQPLRGEHWNASFTPGVALNVTFLGETAFLVPIQLEYRRERLSVGIDGGYVAVLEARDLWFAAVYSNLAVSDSLTLMAEFWGGRGSSDQREAAAFTLGFDWLMTDSLHLLASGAPGFEISGTNRLRWYAYLGLQWDLGLW